jgi:putative zinc-binding metallo-peptidase
VQETEQSRPDLREILAKRICDLDLKIEGSRIERFVQQLYRELEQKRLVMFRPLCYLSDEWGCPSGEPVIGIPFYLASSELSQLEKEMNDLENAREIMMYLRHEAGHAFNYAYKLHKTPEWKQLFGPFRRPYRDHYRPVPFSKNFVRHMAGWYAQKHPDEDFAETFAVWLTPRSGWKSKYKGWGAMAKLRYMDRIGKELGGIEPLRRRGNPDIIVEEMETTVAEFYQRSTEQVPVVDLALDTDLAEIFDASKRRKNVVAARGFLHTRRKSVVDNIAHWTGVQRPLIKQLLEVIEKRLGELGLLADPRMESEYLANITAYATTLTMTSLSRGKFQHS